MRGGRAGPRPAGGKSGQPFPDSLSVVLWIVAASFLVARSSSGIRLLPPPTELPGPWVWIVRLTGMAAAGLGLILLLSPPGGSREPPGRSGTRSPSESLRSAASIMGLLAFVALLVAPPRGSGAGTRRGPPTTAEEAGPDEPGGARGSLPGLLPGNGWGGGAGGGGRGAGSDGLGVVAAAPQPPQSLLRRLARYLPFFLILMAVLLGLFLVRRRRRPAGPDALLHPEDVEAGLLASLDEVMSGCGDPRGQIAAAYRTLLSALTRAGAACRPQEAPHEHLYRVLGPLGVHPEPLHRLAGLHVMAQFSGRSVTERHRGSAVSALEDSLDAIRGKRASLSGPGPVVASSRADP